MEKAMVINEIERFLDVCEDWLDAEKIDSTKEDFLNSILGTRFGEFYCSYTELLIKLIMEHIPKEINDMIGFEIAELADEIFLAICANNYYVVSANKVLTTGEDIFNYLTDDNIYKEFCDKETMH